MGSSVASLDSDTCVFSSGFGGGKKGWVTRLRVSALSAQRGCPEPRGTWRLSFFPFRRTVTKINEYRFSGFRK